MFEQDYIMRLIREMVRAILKLLFNIDTETLTVDLLKDATEQNTLDTLLDMIDAGNINCAENQLYEIVTDYNVHNIEIALLFYSYLNDKSDEFLEEHNFSREEILLGIKALVTKYGLNGMADIFLSDM